MKKNILFVLLTVLLSSCFELDNYDAPNAGINGSLIDSETGEVVYTEQPDGCRIKLLDLGYKDPTPLYFWRRQMVHSVMLPYLRVITRYRRSKVLFSRLQKKNLV